ncbi:MAG: hypothetical protein K2I48_04990, partial [Muribaculaceae bacterium]|nr:hypothetical protein [Muribaculaceae bacterium]
MKKLLLYLVALITMSTLSVDALADKYVYIQKPADDGDVTLWWWGGSEYAKSAGYDHPGPNLKSFDQKGEYPKVDGTVTGKDGNAYYLVGLQDGTTSMQINASGNITINVDQCYSSDGKELGSVSKLIFGEDSDPGYVFYLGGDPFGWNSDATKDDTYKKEANKLKYIGDDTYQITGVTIPANKYFSIYASANGSEFKQYNYSDRNISGTVDSPVALVSNNSAIQTSVELKDVTFTLYVSGDDNYTLSITDPNQVVDPVITTEYSWAAKESAEKAFDLVYSNGVYTLSNALSNVPQAFYLECTKKVYKDGVEDAAKTTTTVYGWTNHTGLEPNGEITLWKENNPITFAEGYENFNLSFAHVDDMPGSVKINFTATKVDEEDPDPTPAGDHVFYVGGSNFGWGPDDSHQDRYEYRDKGVKFVKVGDNVYQATGVNNNAGNNEYITIYDDTYFDGNWETVKQYNYNTDSGYELNGYVNPAMRLYSHSHGIQVKNTLNNATLTIFVNGSDYYMAITEAGVQPEFVVPKVTTVYFIDRQDWYQHKNAIYCYNYSDKGLTEKGGSNVVAEDWPGQSMENITKNPAYAALIAGIQGVSSRGYQVYKLDLTDTQLVGDTYTLPKIIFSNGGSGDDNTLVQTANLYLVKDGIYTNGTGELEDGQIAIKESDYLPRQWYKADAEEGEQCVFTYPNGEVSTPYNYIYVDVDAYTEAYKKGTQISVQLEYELNGERFVATGLSGKHYLSLVTINGKDYLRVAIANDVIPDNQAVKLIVWEGDGNGGSDAQLTPKVSGEWEGCKYSPCTENNISETLHVDCPMNSHCPLIITNAVFVNGALFTRSSEQENIITKTLPTRMYLIDAANNGAFDLAGLEDMKTVLGEDIVAYDVTSTLKDNEYVIPNVPQKAKFFMLGAYDTDSEGVTSTVYHIFSNNNNNLRLPGKNYPSRFD